MLGRSCSPVTTNARAVSGPRSTPLGKELAGGGRNLSHATPHVRLVVIDRRRRPLQAAEVHGPFHHCTDTAPRASEQGTPEVRSGVLRRPGGAPWTPGGHQRVLRAIIPSSKSCVVNNAPVAQLDRAPDFESGGRRFESVRARHSRPPVGRAKAARDAGSGQAEPG